MHAGTAAMYEGSSDPSSQQDAKALLNILCAYLEKQTAQAQSDSTLNSSQRAAVSAGCTVLATLSQVVWKESSSCLSESISTLRHVCFDFHFLPDLTILPGPTRPSKHLLLPIICRLPFCVNNDAYVSTRSIMPSLPGHEFMVIVAPGAFLQSTARMSTSGHHGFQLRLAETLGDETFVAKIAEHPAHGDVS